MRPRSRRRRGCLIVPVRARMPAAGRSSEAARGARVPSPDRAPTASASRQPCPCGRAARHATRAAPWHPGPRPYGNRHALFGLRLRGPSHALLSPSPKRACTRQAGPEACGPPHCKIPPLAPTQGACAGARTGSTRQGTAGRPFFRPPPRPPAPCVLPACMPRACRPPPWGEKLWNPPPAPCPFLIAASMSLRDAAGLRP